HFEHLKLKRSRRRTGQQKFFSDLQTRKKIIQVNLLTFAAAIASQNRRGNCFFGSPLTDSVKRKNHSTPAPTGKLR
ncbi:MAG: hypothetical protein ACK5R2_14490, partial [Cyanobacteriota bacterium]